MGRDVNTLINNRKRGQISIHSPRMGRDESVFASGIYKFYFNPLSPHGERRMYDTPTNQPTNNFNPLSPHGERPGTRMVNGQRRFISIHSPRMGRDAHSCTTMESESEFQSTLPAWGETAFGDGCSVLECSDFNPLSPHGERRLAANDVKARKAISIHSPRMGRDEQV